MKSLKTGLVLTVVCLLIVPLLAPVTAGLALRGAQSASAAESAAASSRITVSELLASIYGANASAVSAGENAVEESYKVYLTEKDEVVTLTPAEYLRGAVAAEMPLTYSDEALKAQIVAAHTYAVSYKLRQKSSPSASLRGADISDDPSMGQAYVDDAGFKELYGDDTAELKAKLDALIGEVGEYIMLYEGEPIVAAYHAISCGKTESARNIWGAYSPYLTAVGSADDENAPDYLSKVTFSVDEVKKLLGEKGAVLAKDPEKWFSNLLLTPSGYVSAGDFGGSELTGSELRELFGLRSACFSVSLKNGVFTFTVKGWGHGVGMSQYGADAMARDGDDFTEILKKYYTGISLCEI